MKKLIAVLTFIVAFAAVATPPEITNVRAAQRTDSKLVDIYYDAADADGDTLTIRIEVSDNDGKRYSVPAFTLTGDIGSGIQPGTGKHIVWDAGTDWDGEYSDQMRVKVFAVDAQGFPGMEWGNECRRAASCSDRTAARKAAVPRGMSTSRGRTGSANTKSPPGSIATS